MVTVTNNTERNQIRCINMDMGVFQGYISPRKITTMGLNHYSPYAFMLQSNLVVQFQTEDPPVDAPGNASTAPEPLEMGLLSLSLLYRP